MNGIHPAFFICFFRAFFFFRVFVIHFFYFELLSRDRGGLLVGQCLCTGIDTGHYSERQGGIRSAVAGVDTA
jgi:hypothetical protein